MNKEIIKKELARLAVYYPQAKRSPDEIEILTDMWEEDIGHLAPDRFRECINIHRKRSSFFPVCADLLAINNEINNSPKGFISLPEVDFTPEEIQANKEGLENLKKKFKMKSVPVYGKKWCCSASYPNHTPGCGNNPKNVGLSQPERGE